MNLLKALRHLVFPDWCLHCHAAIDDQRVVFCPSCLDLLERINPNLCCRWCATSLENPEGYTWCGDCTKTPHRIAATMEYQGPAAAMLRAVKYGVRQDLSKTLAAQMVIQWGILEWPMPDLIIPIPSRNPATLSIAKAFAQMLQVPFKPLLKRRFLSLPQHQLSKEARQQLTLEAFRLIASIPPHLSLLLIDDVMTTGATIKACMDRLEEVFPKRMYALACCKTP